MSANNPPLLDQYQSSVQFIRELWLLVPTPSGRAKRGPRFIAIGNCEDEDGEQYGLLSSGDTKGKRWACKTCYGFLDPVWSDGPLPDIEDIREEWADWCAKQNTNSAYAKTRRMLRLDV